jgi:oligopeptidase B
LTSFISPDQNFLAYLYDDDGSERYTLRIKDLQKKILLNDEIKNVFNIAWANDKQTIFYTTIDSSSRPDKLFRHKLGMTGKNDPLVFNEGTLLLVFISVCQRMKNIYLL